jgi:predicted N-acetyltransferase YhbS
MNLTLRHATPADADAIAALVNAAYRPAKGQQGWTHESALVAGLRTDTAKVLAVLARADSVMLVALHAGAIVACVHVEREGSSAGIGMLAVAPAQQGKGAGHWLLCEAERVAVHTFGAHTLKLVVISARQELVSFYARRGYRKTGAVSPYPAAQGFGTPLSAGLTIEVLEKPASAVNG